MTIRVGEVLYEATKQGVVKWVVIDIYIEDSASPKTVVEVWSSKFGRIAKSPETVCCWHRSRVYARKCMEELL